LVRFCDDNEHQRFMFLKLGPEALASPKYDSTSIVLYPSDISDEITYFIYLYIYIYWYERKMKDSFLRILRTAFDRFENS
jgi:hypothetical protein